MVLPSAVKYTAAAGIVGGGAFAFVRQRKTLIAEREKKDDALDALDASRKSLSDMRTALGEAKAAAEASKLGQTKAQAELATLNSLVRAKEMEVADVQTRLSLVQSELEATSKAKAAGEASAADASTAMKSEIAGMETALAQARESLTSKAQAADKLTAELAALKAQLATAQADASAAAERVATAESTLEAEVSKMESQAEKIASGQEAAIAAATSALNAELTSTQSSVTALKTKLGAAQDELCTVVEASDSLGSAAGEQMQVAYRECMALLGEATADVERLGAAWAGLEKETAAARAALDREIESGSPTVTALNKARMRLADLVSKSAKARDVQTRATLALRVQEFSDLSSGKLRALFDGIDADRSGELSLAEFAKAMDGAGLSAGQLGSLFKGIDTDSSGSISYTEFVAAATAGELPAWLQGNDWLREQAEGRRMSTLRANAAKADAVLQSLTSEINEAEASMPEAEAAAAGATMSPGPWPLAPGPWPRPPLHHACSPTSSRSRQL